MSAYVIFIRESTLDQSELDAYAKAVRPILEGLPIKCLAANGRQLVLAATEGGAEPRSLACPCFVASELLAPDWSMSCGL